VAPCISLTVSLFVCWLDLAATKAPNLRFTKQWRSVPSACFAGGASRATFASSDSPDVSEYRGGSMAILCPPLIVAIHLSCWQQTASFESVPPDDLAHLIAVHLGASEVRPRRPRGCRQAPPRAPLGSSRHQSTRATCQTSPYNLLLVQHCVALPSDSLFQDAKLGKMINDIGSATKSAKESLMFCAPCSRSPDEFELS
jgi:hypothetical protein